MLDACCLLLALGMRHRTRTPPGQEMNPTAMQSWGAAHSLLELVGPVVVTVQLSHSVVETPNLSADCLQDFRIPCQTMAGHGRAVKAQLRELNLHFFTCSHDTRHFRRYDALESVMHR